MIEIIQINGKEFEEAFNNAIKKKKIDINPHISQLDSDNVRAKFAGFLNRKIIGRGDSSKLINKENWEQFISETLIHTWRSKKEDSAYKLNEQIFEKQGKATFEYKHKVFLVYSYELLHLFQQKKLSVQRIDGTETSLNGREYLNAYIKGYETGEREFNDMAQEFTSDDKALFKERLDDKTSPTRKPNTFKKLNNNPFKLLSDYPQYAEYLNENSESYANSEKAKYFDITQFSYEWIYKIGKYSGFMATALKWFETQIRTDEKIIEPETSKLKIDQIALIYVYERLVVTKSNATKIVMQYGHNSGDRLYNRYTYLSSTANRMNISEPKTVKRLNNRIDLLESVLPHLTESAKARAMDEIKTIRNKV